MEIGTDLNVHLSILSACVLGSGYTTGPVWILNSEKML